MFEEPLLPASVDYNYSPFQLTLEMSIPLSDQEQPTVNKVRIWNSFVLKLLEPQAQAEGMESKSGSTVDKTRTDLPDGAYELQYYTEQYDYRLRYTAEDTLVMLEVNRI